MAGTGGQGLLIMGQLVTYAAMLEGYYVVWFPSYGPEARGGSADCTVIISSEEIGSPVSTHPDSFIGMHEEAVAKFMPSIKPGGRIVVNSSLVDTIALRHDCTVIAIPANVIAEEIGNVRVANMVLLGAYAAAAGTVSLDALLHALPEVLPPHRHSLIPLNESALRKGAECFASI